jgi:hypothetical protein
MATYKTYETDREKERDGVRVETSGGTFVVRRKGTSNREYVRALERKFRPYRRALMVGKMDTMKRRELEMEVFVETVLVGWEPDVTGRDEQPLEFTRANAIQLFADLPDLYDEVDFAAEQPETFRLIAREEEAGN